MIYSVGRATQYGYDVPVTGDWVTVAVIAERGPVKLTVQTIAAERTDAEEAAEAKQAKGKRSADENPTKQHNGGKKFINLRLVDFGIREASSTASRTTASSLSLQAMPQDY